MVQLTRRTFVITCAGVAAGAAMPDLRFPTRPRDRLAVASYPFRDFIDAPGSSARDSAKPRMPLTDFAKMVADKFGVHNIEPLASHFASTDATYLRQLRSAVEKAHSRIVDIPVSMRLSFYDPDPAVRDNAISTSKKWVDAAVEVGSPSIRVHIHGARGVTPDVDRTSSSLQQVAEYGASKRVLITLENDDLVSEDAFFLVKVIEKVNNPYLRALPDFGNSMLTGDEKFNYEAVTAMFRHAYNIAHVKDSEVYRGKLYQVDMAKTFAIAKAAGYRGYFSMEWEGDGGPYEGTQHLLDESLKSL